MTYNQEQPAIVLKDFIRCYWWLDNSNIEPLNYTILPDGCFDMVLYFQNYELHRIALTGLYSKAIKCSASFKHIKKGESPKRN